MDKRTQKWGMWAAAGLAAAGLVLVFHLFNPAEGGWFPPCVFFEVTGLYCAGCGAQRALHHLLNGRVLAAVDSNPLLMLTPVVLAPVLAWRRHWFRHPAAPWVVAGLIVGFAVARNLPCWPFTLLAP